MTDWTSFWSVVSWIVYSGGAGVLTLILMNKIKWFGTLDSEPKRWISIGMTIFFAIVAWLLFLWGGKETVPIGFEQWWVKLWSIGGAAYIIGQGTHAVTNLRVNDKLRAACLAKEQEEAAYSPCSNEACDKCGTCK
jgi:hypothetical protein